MLARLRDGGGCVLADEPGLGKTVQALAVIASLVAGGARRVLVVRPPEFVKVWRAEANKFIDAERAGGFLVRVAADPPASGCCPSSSAP